MPTGRTTHRNVEWPTIAVGVAVYGGWMALTAWHDRVPLPLLVLAGGWLIAWHGSLQHEVIHGHPTRHRWINDAIGSVPLSLWLPYRIYRRTHLAHHRTPATTDPVRDPESRYVTGDAGWRAWPMRLRSTLLGQLLLGPVLMVAQFLWGEMRHAARHPLATAGDWVPHLVGVGVVLGWLAWVDLPIGTYLLAFVYPGIALSLLRSYAEHRAELTTPGRAATVESDGALALLFLNNNLHVAHHARPRLAWYRLPSFHHSRRGRFCAEGTRRYAGYREVVRRYLLAPHDILVHPHHRDVVP